MSIEAISAIGVAQTERTPLVQVMPASADFGQVVTHGLQQADTALKVADQQLRGIAAGQDIAPHELMISLEEARMQLTLLTEVRNKLVEGYQELSRMQL